MTIEISARWVIVHNEQLLIADQGKIHCLPGGKIDPGEDTQECVIRELYEELGIKAQNPQLIAIQELIKGDIIRVDFMYLIGNSADFVWFDLSTASHAYEVNDIKWIDIHEPHHRVLPKKIVDIVKNKDFWTVHHRVERI